MPQIEPKHVILAGIIAAAALLAGGLTWYALRGEHVVMRHETYVNEATVIRAVWCPPRVQHYVSRFVPAAFELVPAVPRLSSAQARTGRLDWLHHLPLEFTFLFAQTSPLAHEVTLFAQANPDGPAFAPIINDSGFFYFLNAIQWTPPRLSNGPAGYLVAHGPMPVPQHTQDAVGPIWPGFQPPDTPTPSGDHFFEFVADNSNGALAELHGALDTAHSYAAGLAALQALYELWPHTSRLHFIADLAGDDHIQMRASVFLMSPRDPGQAMAPRAALEAAGEAMAAHLQSVHGFSLEQAVRESGDMLSADYHLRGFQPLLERAFNPRF